MRIRQAVFGACIAAALVVGAGAGPAREAPFAGRQFLAASVQALGDRLLASALDGLGEIEARIRQF